MGLHHGVPRARPDPAKRQVGGHTPRLQIGAVDAFGQPWRVAVNVHPNDGNEVVFWIVDPLSTSRPTASQNRTAVSSWRVARDTGGQENQMAAGLEGTRPVNRESQTVQSQKGERCRKRRSTERTSRHGSLVHRDD